MNNSPQEKKQLIQKAKQRVEMNKGKFVKAVATLLLITSLSGTFISCNEKLKTTLYEL